MTKVIILGQEPEKKKGKPIEFVKFLEADGSVVSEERTCRKKWENIEVVSIGYSTDFDLLFAYNDNRNTGCLYLGHYNDGIVE